MRLENENYSLTVTEEGVIIAFCEKKTGNNFVDKNGKTGIKFRSMERREFGPSV